MSETLNVNYPYNISPEIQVGHETEGVHWEGQGARVNVLVFGREGTLDIFALRRHEDGGTSDTHVYPVVARIIDSHTPDYATDYVLYRHAPTDTTIVNEYRIHREIDDLGEYFEGYWPKPVDVLMEKDKIAKVLDMIDIVTKGAGGRLLGTYPDKGYFMQNIEPLGETELGTPPYYPTLCHRSSS